MLQAKEDVRAAESPAELERLELVFLSQLHNIRRKLEDEFITDAADAIEDLRISVRTEFGRLRADRQRDTQK